MYYSHSYRVEDRDLNKVIWQLFWEAGATFAVDPRSGRLSIPHLETMLRRSAGFVAVVTNRNDVARYLTSPYFVFEYGLAVQANKPRIIFVEDSVSLRQFEESNRVVFNREDLRENGDEYLDRIRTFLGSIGRRPPHRHGRGSVGLILPHDGTYGQVVPAVRHLLDRFGYEPANINIEAPNPHELILEASRHDYVVIDVGDPAMPEWIHTTLCGRVPMVRLMHHDPGSRPRDLPKLLLGHAIGQVARGDELAIWWRDQQELMLQLEREVNLLQPPARGLFRTQEDGVRYFNSLHRSADATVFISNAGSEDQFARDLCDRFRLNYINYFHYRDDSNRIELGSDWMTGLQRELKSSQLFVPLISKAYWNSEVCRMEYAIAQEMRDQGELRIFPYILEEAVGPIVPQQGRQLQGRPVEEQLNRIVRDIDEYLTPQIKVTRSNLHWWADEPNAQVDIALITVLEEEYEAVRRQLEWSEIVPATHEHPNQYAWRYGEIRPDSGGPPFRTVLAIAGQKGTSAGLMTVTSTTEAFRPSYVLLVGIAGGLGDVRKGDVVVADRIFGYEYGMVAGGFWPRPDWNYPTDTAVANAARTMKGTPPDWYRQMDHEGITHRLTPEVRIGPVASGNKVVEDLSDASFKPVVDLWPALLAVEMEGLGAAEAIRYARERGDVVNFAMIRGISDKPSTAAPRRRIRPDRNLSYKTRERDRWRTAAAEVAATFAVQMIRRAWPKPPRDANDLRPQSRARQS